MKAGNPGSKESLENPRTWVISKNFFFLKERFIFVLVSVFLLNAWADKAIWPYIHVRQREHTPLYTYTTYYIYVWRCEHTPFLIY